MARAVRVARREGMGGGRRMQRRRPVVVLLGVVLLLALGAVPAAADPDGQHGIDEGHLLGEGE